MLIPFSIFFAAYGTLIINNDWLVFELVDTLTLPLSVVVTVVSVSSPIFILHEHSRIEIRITPNAFMYAFLCYLTLMVKPTHRIDRPEILIIAPYLRGGAAAKAG